MTVSHQTWNISFLCLGDNCCQFLHPFFSSDKTLFPFLTTYLTLQHRQYYITSEPKPEIYSFFLHYLKYVLLEPSCHILRSLIQSERPCREESRSKENAQPTAGHRTALCWMTAQSRLQMFTTPADTWRTIQLSLSRYKFIKCETFQTQLSYRITSDAYTAMIEYDKMPSGFFQL